MRRKAQHFTSITPERSLNYSFTLPEIDKSRYAAVYIRQSGRKADKKHGESRKMQESLKLFAMRLRREETMEGIRIYDEGAGKSGGLRIDECPELNRLWSDLKSGEIGQVIVSREDRLFRDEHGDQSGAFTRLAQALDILLFIPPFQASGDLDDYGAIVLYNFRDHDHLKAFKRKMDIASDYLTGHVQYMQAARMNKARRGAYDGRRLPPGLVLERHAPKDTRRPVLYEPWANVMGRMFVRAEALSWNAAAMMREIEHLPYLFPEPSSEDLAQYQFCTALTHCPGGGYKPKQVETFLSWFSNVHLIGWWTIGKKGAAITDVLRNNHPAVIDEDIFRRAFVATTGRTLDGELPEYMLPKRNAQRRRAHPPAEALFHGRLKGTADRTVTTIYMEGKPRYVLFIRNNAGLREPRGGLYAASLDREIVERLRALSKADLSIADRVGEYLEKLFLVQKKDKEDVLIELAEIERKIVVLKRRFHALNETPSDQDDSLVLDIAKKIADLTREHEKLEAKRDTDICMNGPAEMQNLYLTLQHFDTYWPNLSLETKQRFMDVLVRRIELRSLSPHWFELHIQWLSAVCPRPDIALLWRKYGGQSDDTFSEEEDEIIREVFPTALKRSELLRRLPKRSLAAVKARACRLRVSKTPGYDMAADFPAHVCWNDAVVAPDIQQALYVIEEARAACTAQAKDAHATWLLGAAPIQDILDTASVGGASNELISV